MKINANILRISLFSVITLLIFTLVLAYLPSLQTNKENSSSDEQDESTELETEDTESIDTDTIDTDTTEDENPVQIEVLTEGTGETVSQDGDTISVNYVGTLLDGTEFDNSYDRGEPFEFTLGAGTVIEGWDEGLLGMKIGEKRKITIPSEKAYGTRSTGSIPANSDLIFEVELLEIN